MTREPKGTIAVVDTLISRLNAARFGNSDGVDPMPTTGDYQGRSITPTSRRSRATLDTGPSRLATFESENPGGQGNIVIPSLSDTPPPLTDRDKVQRSDPARQEAAVRLLEPKAEADRLSDQVDAAKTAFPGRLRKNRGNHSYR